MQKKQSDVVLITGASSGIGKALGTFLSEKGFKVYGTSRKPETGKSISYSDEEKNGFLQIIKLDVTDEKSIDSAVDKIISIEGRIDILINNAGIGLAGAVEDTSLEEAKKQFDTSFFGVHSMCRKVLPVMRMQGKGLIVNIGSVAGFISIPFQSMYSASKFALEAYTEALRMELKPHNIHVTIVDPGDTKTNFTQNRIFCEQSKFSDSAYYDRFKKSIAVMEKDESKAPGPQKTVNTIYSIIIRKNPPVRKVIGLPNMVFAILKKILPGSISELIVSKIYAFIK